MRTLYGIRLGSLLSACLGISVAFAQAQDETDQTLSDSQIASHLSSGAKSESGLTSYDRRLNHQLKLAKANMEANRQGIAMLPKKTSTNSPRQTDKKSSTQRLIDQQDKVQKVQQARPRRHSESSVGRQIPLMPLQGTADRNQADLNTYEMKILKLRQQQQMREKPVFATGGQALKDLPRLSLDAIDPDQENRPGDVSAKSKSRKDLIKKALAKASVGLPA